MSDTKNNLQKETVFGCWDFDGSGNIVWRETRILKIWSSDFREWQNMSTEIIEKTPQEAGLSKEVKTSFIFKKDVKSEDFGESKPQFYKLPVVFRVNPNMSQNIWLRESGKVYLLDINPEMPKCIECSHVSNENISVRRIGKPTKISIKEAQAIIKSGNRYIFGRIVQSGEGINNIEFVTTV
jgi:hypothetical protein